MKLFVLISYIYFFFVERFFDFSIIPQMFYINNMFLNHYDYIDNSTRSILIYHFFHLINEQETCFLFIEYENQRNILYV